ncbi:hypothetical protein EJB05_17415 [Eragrostis curvula]|uniref:Uncharacterized protein n=1 Tax=Eragrostis curvula TaxID=38414 RepID=A0A5J9VH41_9POAL|nr:hypothetical protein EJB05_17415 [Eragrostis curvula]
MAKRRAQNSERQKRWCAQQKATPRNSNIEECLTNVDQPGGKENQTVEKHIDTGIKRRYFSLTFVTTSAHVENVSFTPRLFTSREKKGDEDTGSTLHHLPLRLNHVSFLNNIAMTDDRVQEGDKMDEPVVLEENHQLVSTPHFI